MTKPEIYAKVTAEIRSHFTCYQNINATAMSQMKYLHATVLEAMRMYPPLPLALPRVVPDGGDTVDGMFIPEAVPDFSPIWITSTDSEQTAVSTNPLAANLSPENFASPLEFKPERWLEGKTEETLDASQPFSLGPRGCLGRK